MNNKEQNGRAGNEWSPLSWKNYPIKQQPEYNSVSLDKSVAKLSSLPPLVSQGDVDKLLVQLGECAEGKRFLLQGGDCAERFDDCKLINIANKVKIILQMSFVLTYGAKIPTVRIGRLAGQYAKPRSSDWETVLVNDEEIRVKSYRGDNVNSIDPSDREANPNRLVEGYFHSAATINCLRNILSDGLADVENSLNWEMDFVKNENRKESYEKMAQKIIDALSFMRTVGADPGPVMRSADIFCSHEGLILDYESAMTRERCEKHYNLGAHFVWIGDRTRGLNDAHIEYFRGIVNPIGMKVGPTMDPYELQELLLKLNPKRIAGKVTLITRFGADNVSKLLPKFISAVQEAGFDNKVVWCCDPMHGNTTTATVGQEKFKTRDFDDVLKEVEECVRVHAENDSFLSGVHFELTGDDVTECTGGPENLTRADLPRRYSTHCDPRLNYAQSIEIAFKLAEYLLQKI
eukprot:maker-scaffold_68-snap-gene-0.93-mRNA-1 protein AED:0.01 eAED:0.01 QI:70/1/1/1/0.5/0.33/3/538/460